MGEINDSCVKLVKLKSLSSAEKHKGGKAKCCVATGNCAIESLLCIWSIIPLFIDNLARGGMRQYMLDRNSGAERKNHLFTSAALFVGNFLIDWLLE